jgi:hypothetical protein
MNGYPRGLHACASTSHRAINKYWLSTLPRDVTLRDLVDAAKLRWRVERDYEELKQEVALGHFEGAGGAAFTIMPHCARGLRIPNLREGDDSPLRTSFRQANPDTYLTR